MIIIYLTKMGMKKDKSPENPQVEPVETIEPTPVVKGESVVGELEKLKEFRNRAEDEKLKVKADKIHEIFMGVKPGPITVKPSRGWLSYICGKIRFGALEVGKKTIKIHSLELNDDGKMVCEIIALTSKAKDKVPVTKIRNRAEAYIAERTEPKK